MFRYALAEGDVMFNCDIGGCNFESLRGEEVPRSYHAQLCETIKIGCGSGKKSNLSTNNVDFQTLLGKPSGPPFQIEGIWREGVTSQKLVPQQKNWCPSTSEILATGLGIHRDVFRGENIWGGRNLKFMAQGLTKVLKTKTQLLKVSVF